MITGFNMITKYNEKNPLVKHISYDYRFRLDGKK